MTSSLVIASLVSVAGVGQPPPSALDPKLVAHLAAWEAKQKQVTSLRADCRLVRTDRLTRKVQTFDGQLALMRPNLVRFQMKQTGNGDEETYLCDGKALFHFEPARKTVTEYPTKPGTDPFPTMPFVSGTVTAKDVAERFETKLVKEEPFYVHIELTPRRPADRQEFASVLVVLFAPAAGALAYQPSVVRVQKPNGQEQDEWTFDQKQQTNPAGLTPAAFQFQPPAAGWTHQKFPVPGGK